MLGQIEMWPLVLGRSECDWVQENILIELGKSWRAPTGKFWESDSGYATVLSFHAISTNIKAVCRS